MKNMDLLLVNAGGTKRKVYQELCEDYSAIELPFWAVLTAGFVRDRGFEVGILDANAENLSHEESAGTIEELDPGLTGIVVYGQHPSASTQLMTGVGELCREIKSRNPNRKIILTGLHPSALPERTIREERCDYVGEGEGFYTLQGLLEKNQLERIPGLWWREGGEIRRNERPFNVRNLDDELKNVAWDLLPWGRYKAHNWQCLDDFEQRRNYASLSTSLGCPFRCDFCSISKTFGERGVRFWSPEWAVEQISTLAEKYGVKIFKIIDEMFLLKPEHYLGIAEGLIEKGLGESINIWAYARVDTTKEEHLEKLRKAGFRWLCYGFESGNEEILRSMHKGRFTRREMLNLRRKAGDAGINVLGNYMFGFPEDTRETMQETLGLAQELNCEFANLYCATAWPGSKLYDEVLAKGIKMPDRWQDYAQHAYDFQPLPTNHLSAEEVLGFRDMAFSEYFTSSQYLAMIEKKFGPAARRHIEGMTRIKLKRRLLGD